MLCAMYYCAIVLCVHWQNFPTDLHFSCEYFANSLDSKTRIK